MSRYKNFTRTVKGIPQMLLTITVGMALLGVILSLAACGDKDANTPVKATWIEPQVVGDTVLIPVREVHDNRIVHFSVAVASGGEMTFMAYDVGGKLNIRANVCPPCRSIGFSLSKDTLICDTCRTTFKAKTGDGIAGACVGYPKAAVPYEISDGKAIMKFNDLQLAYQFTNEPG